VGGDRRRRTHRCGAVKSASSISSRPAAAKLPGHLMPDLDDLPLHLQL
jgi:hypothetical protein